MQCAPQLANRAVAAREHPAHCYLRCILGLARLDAKAAREGLLEHHDALLLLALGLGAAARGLDERILHTPARFDDRLLH